MSKIRMGVIGCRVGSRWVDAAKVCDETEAFAVADLDRELAQKIAPNLKGAIILEPRQCLSIHIQVAVSITVAPLVRRIDACRIEVRS